MQNNHTLIVKSKNRRQVNKNSPKTPKAPKKSINSSPKPHQHTSNQQTQNFNYPQKMEPKEKKKKKKDYTVETKEIEKINLDLICAICQDAPKEKAKIQECSHEFCFDCISQWRKIKPNCPLCKMNILNLNYNFNVKTNKYESNDETSTELLIFIPKNELEEEVSLDCLDRQFFLEETETVLQNTEQILKNLHSERSKIQSNFKYINVSKNVIEKRWRCTSEVKNELICLKQEFQYGTRAFDPYLTLKRLHELQNIVLSAPLPTSILEDSHEEFFEEDNYEDEYDEEYGQYESKYFY
eukprot:gene3676-6490_t